MFMSTSKIQARLRQLASDLWTLGPEKAVHTSDSDVLRDAAAELYGMEANLSLLDELRLELRDLRTQLALTTEPKPISGLHEDHGFVLAARYDGDTIDDIRVVHLLDDDFDGEWWTHFYHLARIQPPKESERVG